VLCLRVTAPSNRFVYLSTAKYLSRSCLSAATLLAARFCAHVDLDKTLAENPNWSTLSLVALPELKRQRLKTPSKTVVQPSEQELLQVSQLWSPSFGTA